MQLGISSQFRNLVEVAFKQGRSNFPPTNEEMHGKRDEGQNRCNQEKPVHKIAAERLSSAARSGSCAFNLTGWAADLHESECLSPPLSMLFAVSAFNLLSAARSAATIC